MTPVRTLLNIVLGVTLAASPAWAQGEMTFTTEEVNRGESLFNQIEGEPAGETGGGQMSFDETAVSEQETLACAAGLGCDGLAVSQDEALVLTGHPSTGAAQEAYQEEFVTPEATDQSSENGSSAEGESNSMSFDEADVDGDDSLFDRVEGEQGGETGGGQMSFDETAVSEQETLACAAGLGCEGLAVSQDEALVLTGHPSTGAAQEAYQEEFETPEPTDQSFEGESPVEEDSGSMSFDETEVDGDDGLLDRVEGEQGSETDAGETGQDVNEDLSTQGPGSEMTFTEEEVTENGAEMAFTEEEAFNANERPAERFTDAEIASFSQEQDDLWACAGALGCRGAATGLTPHEALYRLGFPEFSHQWPLAACSTNVPAACAQIGISLSDALRIMAHLVNPNR